MGNYFAKEESFQKLLTEFQEKILEVCDLRTVNISDQLQQILDQELITKDTIQMYFQEILDENQLNQIYSIANEYHLRYQKKRKEIEGQAKQCNLTAENIITQESPQDSLMKDKEIIESSYQQIANEGTEQITKIIQPKLQSCNQPYLDSFIKYLVSNVENFDKKEEKFQDILDGLDLYNKELNQVLEIWEELRQKLKQKKEQIKEIEAKISLIKENNNEQGSQNIEQNEGNHNQTDTIGNLKTEIEELKKQIVQLIQDFQGYVTKYLQEENITINNESIEQLIKMLNLNQGIENQAENIDQIFETLNLRRKQEKEIKAELQKFNVEIQKRRVVIKEKSEQIIQIKEKPKICQQDPKNILINNLIEKLNQEQEQDWDVFHNKDILEQLFNQLKDKIENKLEISEQNIFQIIEKGNLSREKKKKVMNHINNFILELNQLVQMQEALKLAPFNPQEKFKQLFIQQINDLTQIDWTVTHKDVLESLFIYIENMLNSNQGILEKRILSLLEKIGLSTDKEKQVVSKINFFINDLKKLLPIHSNMEEVTINNQKLSQQKNDTSLDKQFDNIFDCLVENKKEICKKQIEILKNYILLIPLSDMKKIIQCQIVIAQYVGEENFILALQEIENIVNMTSFNVFKIYQNWYEQLTETNKELREFILCIQQNYYSKKGKLIQNEIIQKLTTSLSNYCENEIDDIFDNLEFSNKQTKEILQKWKQYQDEIDKDNYQPELLEFKSFIQNQIKDQSLQTKINNNTVQIIVNLLKSSQEEDRNELDEIYDQFSLTKKQIIQIEQEYGNIFKVKKLCESNKKINEPNVISKETLEKQSESRRNKDVSKIYTLVYQLQEYCLDVSNLKVVCDFQQIQELINSINHDEVKCVAFYGDYLLSMKIIQNYFPKAADLIKLDSYQPPNYDQLVAITDGQTIFLILEEQKGAYEGDVFENEEGQLFIRFLLDSCPILITCLNQKQVSYWTNRNPFEQFDAIVPPKQIKDRSSIFVKQIRINPNIEIGSKFLLSNDQNNTIIINQFSEASIIDRNFYYQYNYLIEQNKSYVNQLFFDQNINSYEKIKKVKEKKKNILNIFNKHTELQNTIQNLYDNFEVKINDLLNSFYNKNHIEELLHSSNNKSMKVEEGQNVNEGPNQVQLIQKDSRLQELNQRLELKFSCEDCLKRIYNQLASKFGCANCLLFSRVQEIIQKKINKKKSWLFSYNDDLDTIIEHMNINPKQNELFSDYGQYLKYQSFFFIFNKVSQVVMDYLNQNFSYSLKKGASNEILNFIFYSTYILSQNMVQKKKQLNEKILKEKEEFLNQISISYDKLVGLKEKRISIKPYQFIYDPLKKDEVLLSLNYKIQNIVLSDQAHQLVEYISYDDQVDYVVFNNKNQQDKKCLKTFICMVNKKKVNFELKQIFSIAGSIDVSLFINQYSRQWVIFANDTKKNSIGKINLDYSFEVGRIDTNVYTQKTLQGKQIERVDQCIILNEKNNVVILYEKSKKQFYELFLSGQLKELKFDLQREIKKDGVVWIENIPIEESGDIEQVKNSSEGDFYAFQTKNFIYLTNANYIVKQQIKLKENFSNFKIITSDSSILLITLYQNNSYDCYLIQGIDETEELVTMSQISEEKEKIGNIVIDKVIKSILHYGSNYTQIGCPQLVHLLFFFERDYKKSIRNFEQQIEKYFNDCKVSKNIQFNITHSSKYCFSTIDLLINKIDSLLQVVNQILKEDLQFILQTRIPIQLTTIQQSNYLPLKDGLFKQDLMNVPEVEDQIEQIKKQISFGWIENMVQLQNKDMYVVAMCGRQSVGKSSQLNRLFGTRFGVSASRCTDGIWMGLSKINNKLILVMDCEGLFSIRRTDDEEVKLLLQITSMSDITVIFCDNDGINQPLLSLFKKLQICAGKMKSDSFFLGSMVLLTKNVSDQGDKKKLQLESQSHLDKKETKAAISKIFPKGLSYGFLKNFLAKDYDSNLQKVRDDLFYKEILQKNQPKNPLSLMSTLKYSMIQIYLNDDQDIDLISKESEIKEEYNKFVEYFYDISKQKFINNEKLEINFEYKPITEEEEKQCINNDQKIFKYGMNLKQNTQNDLHNAQQNLQVDETNLDILNAIAENNLEEDDKSNQEKAFNFLQLNQCQVLLFSQNSFNINLDKKSQNCETLQNIFEVCFKALERANFDNYKQQMQKFFNMFIEQRKTTIKEYFDNRMPKDNKYRDIVNKYEKKLNNILNSLDKQLILCTQQCNKCNRTCLNMQGHKGNCNCGTSHICYFKCEICNSENECFLTSGHSGTHFCLKVNHHCQRDCQISSTCKQQCTLEPHSDNIKHSCQGQHKCEFQCRLYDKCGKTCSLQSGHEDLNHLCDSNQCYDKCEFCDKPCGFNLHDHDLLLSNPQKNKELLMKEGKLVTKHLCGDYHTCVQKCEKPGVCSISYKAEEKIWESQSSKFEYQFIKPHKTQKECSVKIQPWQTTHEGLHECENFQPHRCDQQCPECLSYCIESYNHSGNHHSKNHRNKENCVFISESNQIKIDTELGNTRKYIPGESSIPENCLQSCLRMGRAHVHLRVCNGGDECAEKKYSFARHSTKKYKPYTHLVYDEMLCKGYWNSINWEPPAEEENLQIIQSCNSACAHESHGNLPNFCTKLAWHEGPHQIEYKNCDHIGSGIVDICFTIDTTGSMGWVFKNVSKTVNNILEKFEGKADIKYSIVSYRDHPPQDNTYVYKIDSQLTDKVSIQNILANMSADGGGDTPEAVMDGLYHSITEIKWREDSQRYIFHICDSPPHGKQFGISSKDSSWTKNGCPCRKSEYEIADQLSSKKIFYYLVKVNSSLNMMENIFQSLFGNNFKQTIELQDTSKLNIEIISALSKEIFTSNEYYHIK